MNGETYTEGISFTESRGYARGRSYTVGRSRSQTHWSEQGIGINPECLQDFIKGQSLAELRGLAKELKAATDPNMRTEMKHRLLFEMHVALNLCPDVLLSLLLKEDES